MNSRIRDPVCGNDLTSFLESTSYNPFTYSISYKGATVYFCSDECKTKFSTIPPCSFQQCITVGRHICSECKKNVCDPHNYVYRGKNYCTSHPIPLAKELDKGVAFLSQWRVSSERSLDTDIGNDLLVRADRAREKINLCSRRLRNGGRAQYHGWEVVVEDLPELRKYLRNRIKRFQTAKKLETKRAVLIEIDGFSNDLTSIPSVPERRSSQKYNIENTDVDIKTSSAWMSHREKSIVQSGIKPPLFRIQVSEKAHSDDVVVVDPVLTNLRSFKAKIDSDGATSKPSPKDGKFYQL